MKKRLFAAFFLIAGLGLIVYTAGWLTALGVFLCLVALTGAWE